MTIPARLPRLKVSVDNIGEATMADAVWYYAVNDEELGPVTAAKLKSLADAGTIKPDDLVWREGLSDWKPAREIAGLFSGEALSSPAAEQTPGKDSTPAIEAAPRRPRSGRGRSGRGGGNFMATVQSFGYGRAIGMPLLLIGLMLVLFSKGCDTVLNRYAGRATAKHQLEQGRFSEFQEDWNERRSKIQDSSDTSTEKSDRMKRLDKELSDKRKKLQELADDARDAKLKNQMYGFLREALFVFGTMVLTLGLLSVGITGQGAERWVCLVMLAIITFSLYVGGIAWVGTLSGLMP